LNRGLRNLARIAIGDIPPGTMARWLKFVFLSIAIAAVLFLWQYAMLLAAPAQAQQNFSRCTYKGIRLSGKVAIVQAIPDLKVQVVNSGQDLNVKFVENFPDECGEWQIVNIFPDFRIQFVEIFPDLKIKLVNSSPGLPSQQRR
jgi:hypothetical protein